MKQSVEPSKYDRKYFEKFEYIDYANLPDLGSFGHIYQTSGSMLKLDSSDKAVDLGCGSGQLSFYLYLKYNCDVTGIDYSPDAIDLCKKNLELLASRQENIAAKEKIRFINSANQDLPAIRDVEAVFLVDVIEHLHENEVDLILEKIKQWKKPGGLQLIIHTDNNNYLRFIRPLMDIVSLCLGKKTMADHRKEKAYDLERHVNLTTAGQLKKKLASHGFRVTKIKYAPIDLEIVKLQLDGLAKFRPLLHLAYGLGKMFFFLRPSFYLLASG